MADLKSCGRLVPADGERCLETANGYYKEFTVPRYASLKARRRIMRDAMFEAGMEAWRTGDRYVVAVSISNKPKMIFVFAASNMELSRLGLRIVHENAGEYPKYFN